MEIVTAELVREYFDYDPMTGIFIHRNRKIAKKPTAGTENKRPHSNYIVLCINRKKVYAHRAAWMHVHGDIADGFVIDHIDGDGTNNRIANLRLVSKSMNQRNRRNKIVEGAIAGIYPRKGGFVVRFLQKDVAWKRDYFEACCIRKSLEAANGFT